MLIICHETQSCAEMAVTVIALQDNEFIMQCKARYSCQDVTIKLLSNDEDNLLVLFHFHYYPQNISSLH